MSFEGQRLSPGPDKGVPRRTPRRFHLQGLRIPEEKFIAKDAFPSRTLFHHGRLAPKEASPIRMNSERGKLGCHQGLIPSVLSLSCVYVWFTPLQGILLNAFRQPGENGRSWRVRIRWIYWIRSVVHNNRRYVCQHLVHAEFWTSELSLKYNGIWCICGFGSESSSKSNLWSGTVIISTPNPP